ncbi:MAG: hypothetical protein HY903_08810 [Deltaproteobacteria bacterium]|nr:hypothetical protein [Deltaproteobacteria bacterium]
MLLLTTLTVGGSAEVGIFDFLSAPARDRAKEKAQALLQIPSEKRVPFMVHEIREALSFKGLRGVERVDPSWILQAMKGENPRVVATILISLPAPSVRSILKRLPSGIRTKLPPKEEAKRIPIDLVRSVRQIFESRFHSMPAPTPNGFAFRDVIQLDRAEIYRLMRDLGLIELGQAFVAVGKMALAELCRRLPRDKAEELILAVRAASRADAPDVKSAQRFLSRIVPNFTDTEEFFQKSGLWRLAKASLLEPAEFRPGFKQRLPREAGQLYEQYLEKAAEMDTLTEDVLKGLQDSVLLRIQDLARRGVILPRWGEVQMIFHNPQNAGGPKDPGPGAPAAGGGSAPEPMGGTPSAGG